MSALIADHVWRPRPTTNGRARPACEFMNCRRPAAAHERVVSGKLNPRRGGAR